MHHLSHLPIWRDANRRLLAIERAVRQFPHDHKYTIGAKMRRQAMTVCRLIRRAADQGEDPAARVARLVEAVDDLKLPIQLGSDRAGAVATPARSARGLRRQGYRPGGLKRRVRRDLFVGPGGGLLATDERAVRWPRRNP